MRKVIYCSGELGIDKHHQIMEISTTKKGLKVEFSSCYWDTVDHIIFIEESDKYNRNTDYSEMWNEVTTVGDCFEEYVNSLAFNPEGRDKRVYRIIKK